MTSNSSTGIMYFKEVITPPTFKE
ncbi:hypothetical protein ACQ27_gp475 [Klebsiella phage K64-1]|nr:hypothetical protein ACQ27_gp475 [Klebsiella phage K64-1]